MAWQIHSQHNQLHNDMMQYEPQQQQAMYQDDYIHNDPDLAFDPPFDLALGNMSSREGGKAQLARIHSLNPE